MSYSRKRIQRDPIRVVTGAPGSTAEFAARSLAQGLSARLGQPAVVDPRAAGGGTVFGEIVAKALPDGYTLLVIGSSFWIGPLFRKAPYDVIRDFAPIAILADSPNMLVVHPSLPVASVKDLIDLAKAKPGALNYSTSGIGASPHLAAELFKAMAGVDIAHIPFKGAGASIIGVMGAQVQLSFASAASVTTHISRRQAQRRWRLPAPDRLRCFPICRRWRPRSRVMKPEARPASLRRQERLQRSSRDSIARPRYFCASAT